MILLIIETRSCTQSGGVDWPCVVSDGWSDTITGDEASVVVRRKMDIHAERSCCSPACLKLAPDAAPSVCSRWSRLY